MLPWMLSVEPETDERKRPKSTIDTAAFVVTALAALFSVVVQSKDHPRLATGLVIVAVVVGLSTFWGRTSNLLRNRADRARKNELAKQHYSELMLLVKRFSKFVNSSDSSNLQYVIPSLCSNNPEIFNHICGPDYMRDIFPHFQGRLEKVPFRSEADLCAATGELYCLVASYNRHYVLDPFVRMRSTRWQQVSTVVQTLVGDKPGLGPWLGSLPPQTRDHAERQIEAAREKWVGFLNDLQPFLEKINAASLCDGRLPEHLERPQRL